MRLQGLAASPTPWTRAGRGAGDGTDGGAGLCQLYGDSEVIPLKRRTAIALILGTGIGFAAGYFVAGSPGWVLWEQRATTVRATTEFYRTRWGCRKTRDDWNSREKQTVEDESARWHKDNPNPFGLQKLLGPMVIWSQYECYPVGVNPGMMRPGRR